MNATTMKEIERASVLGVESDIRSVRREREEIAQRALVRIWRRRWRILATVVAADVLAIAWLVVAEPRYASTATLEFGFGTVPTMAVGTEGQGVDANSVVESAARMLRSRNVAASVSDALKLEQDPDFAHAPKLERVIETLRDRLNRMAERARRPEIADAAVWKQEVGRLLQRLATPPRRTPSARELSVNEVMRRLSVTHEPHTYLIAVSATGKSPEIAAEIANRAAGEYLRQERRLRAETQLNDAEREVETLTVTLGDTHPDVLRAKGRLNALRKTFQDTPAVGVDAAGAFAAGRLVHSAEALDLPSSPNPKLTLQVASAVGLLVGLCLTLIGLRRR